MQLAAHLGLPLSPAARGGTDYATGGATTTDMQNQVEAFLATTPNPTPTTLFTLSGGSNDIIKNLRSGKNQTAMEQTAIQSVNTLKAQIERLAAAGGRHFVWLNLSPLERTPLAIRSGTAPRLPPIVAACNHAWNQAVVYLRIQFPRISIHAIDLAAITTDIINHPENYGIKDVSNSGKNNPTDPEKRVFADDLHPTRRVHEIVASAVLNEMRRHWKTTTFTASPDS